MVCATLTYGFARKRGQFGTCAVFTKADKMPTGRIQQPLPSLSVFQKHYRATLKLTFRTECAELLCNPYVLGDPPKEGTKLELATSVLPGAHKWGELLRNPRILGGPQKMRQN